MGVADFFTYGSVLSTDYGVHIYDGDVFSAPTRDVTYLSVPGRSGALIIDNGRWNNRTLKYQAVIDAAFIDRFDSFRAALAAASESGYVRLTDTVHPGEFRKALFVGAMTPTVNGLSHSGTFEIEFNCQPQRWLVSGETATSVSSGQTITNPTGFASKPLIRVSGSGAGTLTVGSTTVSLNTLDDYLYLDCEEMNVYRQTAENRNAYMNAGNFPVLEPGVNTISFAGGISAIEITPRWFVL